MIVFYECPWYVPTLLLYHSKLYSSRNAAASFTVEKRLLQVSRSRNARCKFHGREMPLQMQYGLTYIITKRKKVTRRPPTSIEIKRTMARRRFPKAAEAACWIPKTLKMQPQ